MTRSLQFAAATAIAILATGCTVGPKYQAPVLQAPEKFVEAPDPAEAVGLDLAAWWKSFNDPVLASLIERASKDNLDLQAAEARIKQSRAALGATTADLYPTIDANGSATRNRRSQNTGPDKDREDQPESVGGGGAGGPYSNVFRSGFDAAWELDFFGGKKRANEAAAADVEAQQEQKRDLLVTLQGEVADAYIQLRGFQQQLAITDRNVASQRKTLELTQARLDAGLTTELDVARARAQVASTSAEAPPLAASIRRSIFRLSVLMGEQPGALIDELTPVAEVPQLNFDPAPGTPTELLRRRSDLRAVERGLAAATARIGAATANRYPQFAISGNIGLEASHLRNFAHYDSMTLGFGPRFNWAVFDWGRVESNIALQRARAEEQTFRYEQTVLLALEETESAITSLANERKRLTALGEAVAANKRAVELANDLYKNGLADFLNVLEAERNLFAAESQYTVTSSNVSQRQVAVFKALGGGWE